jgi:hypothetical protein
MGLNETELEEYNVRVEFKGKKAKDFKIVKDDSGLEANTEVIRNLVTEKANQIKKQKK